jgi:hypothetical protein
VGFYFIPRSPHIAIDGALVLGHRVNACRSPAKQLSRCGGLSRQKHVGAHTEPGFCITEQQSGPEINENNDVVIRIERG